MSIATTRTSAKRDQLLQLGADHVIVMQEEDLVALVKDMTDGKGARLVFDPVGAATSTRSPRPPRTAAPSSGTACSRASQRPSRWQPSGEELACTATPSTNCVAPRSGKR